MFPPEEEEWEITYRYDINLTIWLVERVITSCTSGLLATTHTTFNLIFGIFLWVPISVSSI